MSYLNAQNDAVFERIKNFFDDEDAVEHIQAHTMAFMKLMSYYKCALMEIETKLKVLNEEYRLQNDRNPICSIKTRLKSPGSIKNKLDRRNLPATIDNMEEYLSDIAGVRVICSFPDDVYTIADALLKQDDIILLKKKDYIAKPKQNGYRSLHMIVAIPIFLENEKRMMKVEIQLRTIAMDCWASLEHQLRYKKDYIHDDSISKELWDCARLSEELDLRMENLRKHVLIG